MGGNTFLRGRDFYFHYMFKTNFSGRNSIWGGTAPERSPVTTGLPSIPTIPRNHLTAMSSSDFRNYWQQQSLCSRWATTAYSPGFVSGRTRMTRLLRCRQRASCFQRPPCSTPTHPSIQAGKQKQKSRLGASAFKISQSYRHVVFLHHLAISEHCITEKQFFFPAKSKIVGSQYHNSLWSNKLKKQSMFDNGLDALDLTDTC